MDEREYLTPVRLPAKALDLFEVQTEYTCIIMLSTIQLDKVLSF